MEVKGGLFAEEAVFVYETRLIKIVFPLNESLHSNMQAGGTEKGERIQASRFSK